MTDRLKMKDFVFFRPLKIHIISKALNAKSTSKPPSLIIREVKFMTDRLKMKDEQNEVVSDWKFAAMVIDR